ncbi:hypothetical protein FB2170_15463 [Maribacter sp. HTCC2170]|nr:hypothetical protein FB2170_15463 [Maribacter sp. HTCC2170]
MKGGAFLLQNGPNRLYKATFYTSITLIWSKI